MLSLSLLLLNGSYGFQGTGRRLGAFEFVSQALSGVPRGEARVAGNRFEDTWLENLPVPLPAPYLLGIDVQKADFEDGSVTYLCGQLYERGQWWFYPLALFVKVPLGTLLLAAGAVLTYRRGGEARSYSAVLIVPPMLIACLVMVQSSINYFRYFLPALPFLFIAISSVGHELNDRSRWFRGAVLLGLLMSVAASLASFPHSLAFFNSFGGGVRGGHRLMVDNNCDWGQDLVLLRRWLDQHSEVDRLHLAYFGRYPPALVGIEFSLPPARPPASLDSVSPFQPPEGWYAVSATHAAGAGRFVQAPGGDTEGASYGSFRYFSQLEAVDVIGGSILVYRVTPPDSR